MSWPAGKAPLVRRSKFAPDQGFVKCVGMDCTQREECLRHRRHPAIAQRWASYDIERRIFEGRGDPACPHFLEV